MLQHILSKICSTPNTGQPNWTAGSTTGILVWVQDVKCGRKIKIKQWNFLQPISHRQLPEFKRTVFSLAWQLVPTSKCKLNLIEGLLISCLNKRRTKRNIGKQKKSYLTLSRLQLKQLSPNKSSFAEVYKQIKKLIQPYRIMVQLMLMPPVSNTK